MTRVALCISGQPRYALESFPYIKQFIIEPNNPDIFIHMNFESGYVEKSHLDNGQCYFEKDLDQKTLECYKPIAWLIESPKEFNYDALNVPEDRLKRFQKMNAHKMWSTIEHKNHIVKSTMNMFYSIFKVNELKEVFAHKNKFIYDYVIRLRFDAVPQKPLICKNFDPNFLYYQQFNQPDNLIFDWINFGSNTIMNVFSSIYIHLDYLNSLRFFPRQKRQINTWEPSDICGAYNEGMIRDMMDLFFIPSQKIDLNLGLGVEMFRIKKKVLIVTSTYKDSHLLDTWIGKIKDTNEVSYKVLVYEKHDSLETLVINESRIKIPNMGRCDYSFFCHIVQNYENLHQYDSIVFTKCNWEKENIPFFAFLKNVHLFDFSDVGNSPKVQVWNKELIQCIPEESKSNFEIQIEHQISDNVSQTVWNWYLDIFPNIEPPSAFFSTWGCGPVFSVSPNLIKRHPKSVYQYMLDRFSPTNWNCETGLKTYNTMERLAHDVGLRYHDHCLRFYRVLFTHNIAPGFHIQLNHNPKRCILLHAGRFYNANNNIYKCLQRSNIFCTFDLYLFVWETEYRRSNSFVNDVEDIKNKFHPEKMLCEAFELDHKLDSFSIMVYIRTKVIDFFLQNEVALYHYYIFSRPDILSVVGLDLSVLTLEDNVLYCYTCPIYAKIECFDFCDWLFICNRFTLVKINNIDYKYNSSKSNEWNFKTNYLNNGIIIKTLGIVEKDILYKDLY
jgi:hypothetical protein